jgi:hypothetical protein
MTQDVLPLAFMTNVFMNATSCLSFSGPAYELNFMTNVFMNATSCLSFSGPAYELNFMTNVFMNATSCLSFSGPAYELNFLRVFWAFNVHASKCSAACSDFKIRKDYQCQWTVTHSPSICV